CARDGGSGWSYGLDSW
nr:immunoglobulin heavy chain junction region [Macaca mulatta]MPN83893.1 immunoglobulin heavy chain junction region [Macaca mulatta]MPN83916.1 immunoglobulin heavy chain junction region [Macaca mulatta]MPN83919.1 immunoglobulin heavy chain junction region [Macaca mulatta]MPN83922.1 immunoglobulin heavy chain junction region [Macaca mulatta]